MAARRRSRSREAVFSQQYLRRLQIPWMSRAGYGSQRFGHARARHPHAVRGRPCSGTESPVKRRSATKAVTIQGRSASGSASTTCTAWNPPTLRPASTSRRNRRRNSASFAKTVDELDRDRAPAPRPAEEHLALPPAPRRADQNVWPDLPRVSWPRESMPPRHREGIADTVNPPEPDDPRKQRSSTLLPAFRTLSCQAWLPYYGSFPATGPLTRDPASCRSRGYGWRRAQLAARPKPIAAWACWARQRQLRE